MNTCLLIVFGAATIYFGVNSLQLVPMLVKLPAALFTGEIKWPGPRIHDPNHGVITVRQRLGVGYQNLFPTFISSSLGVIAVFAFSLLTFLSSTSLLNDYVMIKSPWVLIIMSLFALVGGSMSLKKTQRNMIQLNMMFSDLATEEEPRAVDGLSARSEYAIEHPLIGVRNLPSNRKRALDQFYESVRCYQDGNEVRALSLYHEAKRADPSLHENARETLSNMARAGSLTDVGPIYYWLGLHSEYLKDYAQAADYYEKAVNAFDQIGYKKRASRACNNLGSVKMQMQDPSAMEEFEKSIALDPANGIAHISVGVIYYRISTRGDPRFEQALDAFANAIVADPAAYKPLVLSRLRSIGYTWKEDWEDISRRVVSRQSDSSVEKDDPPKRPDELKDSRKQKNSTETTEPVEKPKKTYKNEKHGIEIDVPEEWRPFPFPIPSGGPRDLIQIGCYDEAFNFEIGPLSPEPPLEQTERDFVQFALARGFSDLKFSRITVRDKEHVCASYYIRDGMGERWNKKYMIVFAGIEYAITATCNDKKWFAQREKDWDAIVQSFRLLSDAK